MGQPKRPAVTPEAKVRKIKAEVARAVANVGSAGSDSSLNRSTQTRRILKAKADAFDRIADIAAGRV